MNAYLKKTIRLRHDAEQVSSLLPALMIEAEKIAYNIHHGEHAQRKNGAGEKFWQFREYVPGDRPQDIDWRQSAKTDHIFIRQKELQATQKTWFWCASDKGMDYASNDDLRTKHEVAQIITLALSILMTRAEEQVAPFGSMQTGRSEQAIQKIGLAILSQKHQDLPPLDSFSLPVHSSFVAVGDFLTAEEKIKDCFEILSLRKTNAIVIQVLDPAELDLDFSGRVLFEGTKQSDRQIIDHVPSVRVAYQERLKAHIDNIHITCVNNNWLYALHRTDQDIVDTINRIWQNLHPQKAGI